MGPSEGVFRAPVQPYGPTWRFTWVAISGVATPLIWVITIVILLITLLITAHEAPSRAPGSRGLFGMARKLFHAAAGRRVVDLSMLNGNYRWGV